MIIKQQMGFRPSPPVDWAVRDGDLIAFGQETLKVIHTPGHTPGGICLYGHGVVFTQIHFQNSSVAEVLGSVSSIPSARARGTRGEREGQK